MAFQTVVVRLPAPLAREVGAWIHRDDTGYESISEFASVAFANQLELEKDEPRPLQEDSQAPPVRDSDLLRGIPLAPPEELTEGHRPTAPLFALTNRMSPMKVAVRVLANLRLTEGWPEVKLFQDAAARDARRLGQRLRAKDNEAGRRGFARRWVAYPVGKDEQSALDRYVSSFTLAHSSDETSGPLTILGLAHVDQGRAILTPSGWDLAAATSPILDGAGAGVISDDEAILLREALATSPQEIEAVRSFLQAVEAAEGRQGKVDQLIQAENPDWSQSQVQSFRSAQIGRLSDLRLLSVVGRGAAARIDAAGEAQELLALAEGTAS